jgi:hypothetical protein
MECGESKWLDWSGHDCRGGASLRTGVNWGHDGSAIDWAFDDDCGRLDGLTVEIGGAHGR